MTVEDEDATATPPTEAPADAYAETVAAAVEARAACLDVDAQDLRVLRALVPILVELRTMDVGGDLSASVVDPRVLHRA